MSKPTYTRHVTMLRSVSAKCNQHAIPVIGIRIGQIKVGSTFNAHINFPTFKICVDLLGTFFSKMSVHGQSDPWTHPLWSDRSARIPPFRSRF